MDSSSIFTADEPETESSEERYNISDVGTVFQLAQDVSLPVEDGVMEEIPEITLGDSTVVLPTGTKVLAGDSKLLPLTLEGGEQVLQLSHPQGGGLLQVTVQNNQVLPIQSVLPHKSDQVLHIQDEDVYSCGQNPTLDLKPANLPPVQDVTLQSTTNNIPVTSLQTSSHTLRPDNTLSMHSIPEIGLSAPSPSVPSPSLSVHSVDSAGLSLHGLAPSGGGGLQASGGGGAGGLPSSVELPQMTCGGLASVTGGLPVSGPIFSANTATGTILDTSSVLPSGTVMDASNAGSLPSHSDAVLSSNVRLQTSNHLSSNSGPILVPEVALASNASAGVLPPGSNIITSASVPVTVHHDKIDVNLDLPHSHQQQQQALMANLAHGNESRVVFSGDLDAMDVSALPVDVKNDMEDNNSFVHQQAINLPSNSNSMDHQKQFENRFIVDREASSSQERFSTEEFPGKDSSLSLEDFVEIYTIFKCKQCIYTCTLKDDLYKHVKEKHSELLNVEAPPENSSKIELEDDSNEKTDAKTSTSTLIVGDLPTGSARQSPTYLQFFLVKDQKRVYICTQCSVCMLSEDKMKMHVRAGNCADYKCKNCGQRLANKAQYKEHTSKCKIAIFKIKDKKCLEENAVNISQDETTLEADEEDIIDDPEPEKDPTDHEQEENVAIVDDFYQSSDNTNNPTFAAANDHSSDDEGVGGEHELESGGGGGVSLSQEEYKVQRLTRNRTELEVDWDKRVLVCSVRNCYATFKSEENLNFHMSCHDHSNVDQLVCPFCGLGYSRWQHLAQHIYTSHNKDYDMYECLHCRQYKCASVSSLEKHYQTHENLRLFKCSVCQKGFNQRVQLRNHYVMHLKKHGSDIPNWAKARKCDLCNKVLADSKILKKHVQAVHSKLKPYICKICGYKSSRNTNLRLHVRQHSGSKPFQCTECDYKTGDRSALRRHSRRHTKERPFKCDLCDFSAIQSSNLKKHILTKHKDPLLLPNQGQEGGPKKKIITLKAGKPKDFTLADDLLGDKTKEVPSIHTLDSLLALAEQT